MGEQTMPEKQSVVMKLNIPFCTRKPSFVGRPLIETGKTDLVHHYIMALAKELAANAEEFQDCRIKAIRLGGGTASIMNGTDFDNLCRLIRERYDLAEDAGITMRTSPADINGANQPFYNRNHVTRYDLEFFSLEPQDFIHLDYLNYLDQLPYISSGFLRASQRPVMGIILLYGKKTVSRWGFRRSVLEATRKPFSHVLLQKCAGEDQLDDESCSAQLTEAAGLLSEAGFVEYLPKRWAKPGCEDLFWTEAAAGTPVLGFGLGAKTCIDGAFSCNTDDLQLYLKESGNYEAITTEAGPSD
jgi:oxygen-independent coproporphyrinogen-3 oxidase